MGPMSRRRRGPPVDRPASIGAAIHGREDCGPEAPDPAVRAPAVRGDRARTVSGDRSPTAREARIDGSPRTIDRSTRGHRARVRAVHSASKGPSTARPGVGQVSTPRRVLATDRVRPGGLKVAGAPVNARIGLPGSTARGRVRVTIALDPRPPVAPDVSRHLGGGRSVPDPAPVARTAVPSSADRPPGDRRPGVAHRFHPATRTGALPTPAHNPTCSIRRPTSSSPVGVRSRRPSSPAARLVDCWSSRSAGRPSRRSSSTQRACASRSSRSRAAR